MLANTLNNIELLASVWFKNRQVLKTIYCTRSAIIMATHHFTIVLDKKQSNLKISCTC